MQPKWKLIGTLAVYGITTLHVFIMPLLGDRMNREPVLGCFVVGSFLFFISLSFFLWGALPYSNLTTTDTTVRSAFRFSLCCVAYSLFQIPLWSILSGRFPPDGFNTYQAIFITTGVTISMFGSPGPFLVMLYRRLKAANSNK